MFNSSLTNNDCESIDFDFFASEGDHVKTYGESKQSDGYKIVTKAVIETNPSKSLRFKDNLEQTKSYVERKNNEDRGNSKMYGYHEILSSPSSSLEKTYLNSANLDESLLNCLAYNDESYGHQETGSISSEDKECSNNSLSDSTITTVTSDFTSVSLFSCLSASSCLTDASLDSFTPQDNENDCTEDIKTSDSLNEQDMCKSENEDNVIETCDNNFNGISEFSDYDQCIESKENLNGQFIINGRNVEDELEIGYNESNSNQIPSNGYGYGSEGQQSLMSDEETECDNEKQIISVDDNDENSNSSVIYESDYESDSIKENGCTSHKNSNISVSEGELGDFSQATQLSSKSHSLRTPVCRSSSKIRIRRKECNLTFSREELIKIERDNLTLLKKIMAHAKPRTVSLNQPFSHKKTSAAINRAKQQKKIDQDNYILYSKISAMGRTKRVF